jgi:hypothetical protein
MSPPPATPFRLSTVAPSASPAPFVAAPQGVFVFGPPHAAHVAPAAAPSRLVFGPSPATPNALPVEPQPSSTPLPPPATDLPPSRATRRSTFRASTPLRSRSVCPHHVARTLVQTAHLAHAFDPSALSQQGDGYQLLISSRSPATLTIARLQHFGHIKAEIVIRDVPCRYKDGRVGKIRTRIAELRGPAADIAAFRELSALAFDPRTRGLATYAFKSFTTEHEARRRARESGHLYTWCVPVALHRRGSA